MHLKPILAVTQIVNNVTIMLILLTEAALIREQEHGTIEHLLVMLELL